MGMGGRIQSEARSSGTIGAQSQSGEMWKNDTNHAFRDYSFRIILAS